MRALIVLALIACSSGPGAREPAAAGPPCDQIAAHLVQLAIEDNQATGLPADLEGLEATIAETCERENWTAEHRQCLAAAGTQDETLRCEPIP